MSEKEPHILQSWLFDGKGGGKKLESQHISGKLKDKDLAWIHLDVNNSESRKWIERELTYLDRTIIDALLEKDTRPRLTEVKNGMMIILRGVNTNPESEPEDMVSLRIWIDPHRIITLQRRPLKSIKDIVKKIEDGEGPIDAGDFLSMVCTRLFQYIDSAITLLSDEADDIEDAILDRADASYREKIVNVRKQSIIYKKFILPQREVVSQVVISRQGWISDQDRMELRENHNQLIRYIEELDSIRERAQVVQDELTAKLSDKLNRNLYVLSIITAIFLPLGFLTGLFGINIGGMPGVDNPMAFWIFVASLSIIVAIQAIIFKIMRWF